MIFRLAGILALVLITALPAAQAEPLLVVTEGANAQRLATGAYAHLIDTNTNAVSPGLLASETRWTGDWTLAHDAANLTGTGALHVARSRNARMNTRYPVQLRLDPFRVESLPSLEPLELVAAVPARTDKPESSTVGFVYRDGQHGVLAYTVAGRTISLPLSMQPVAAVPGVGGESIVVILRDPESGGFGLQWCDTTGARTLHRTRTVGVVQDRFEVTLDHIARSSDGTRLVLGFSGYPLNDAGSDRGAWVEVWNLEDRSPIAASKPLEGTWNSDAPPIAVSDGDAIWTVTGNAARGFAYLTKLRALRNELSVVKLHSFSGVHDRAGIALCPEGDHRDHVALALNRRLLLFDEAMDRVDALDLETQISALAWTAEALYIGTGNKLLRHDGHPTAITEFQTGHIRAIQPLPRNLPTVPDAVAPATPRLPKQIVFDESRIGVESYVLPKSAADSIVQKPDWIRIQPLDDDYATVSIDPDVVLSPESAVAELLIQHTPNGIQKRITLRLRSNRDTVTRLLWVRNPNTQPQSVLSPESSFTRIVRHLGRYPWMVQHDELAAARMIDLSNYAGVVITSADATHGVLTRQEILDYLATGGIIFFFASAPTQPASLHSARWLDSVGMHINPVLPVHGRVHAPKATGLLRHWNTPEMSRGMQIMTSDPRARLVPVDSEGEGAVMATGTYGLGRVIAVASSTLIQNSALHDPRALRFAESLFEVVGNTRDIRSDADLDGIPDYIEDRNGNGRHDPGETDFRNADSDGDGILDGLEDSNQNGFVDELETHPLLADTDADGTLDPADQQPLPLSGTPYIASVEPGTMPAEGSRPILISGRNFSSDSQIWFGPAQAPQFRVLSSTRVEAIAPPKPTPDNDAFPLRIVNSDTGQAAELTGGFTYTPPSTARLTLHPLRTAREVYGIYSLQTQAMINPIDIKLDLVKMVLSIDPPDAIGTIEIVRGQNLSTPVVTRPLEPGRYLVLVTDIPAVSRPLALFQVRMRVNMIQAGATHMRMRLDEKVVRSNYGGMLDTSPPSELLYDFATGFQPYVE